MVARILKTRSATGERVFLDECTVERRPGNSLGRLIIVCSNILDKLLYHPLFVKISITQKGQPLLSERQFSAYSGEKLIRDGTCPIIRDSVD